MNGKPTAAPARFPYREHRNMEQVMRDEAIANLRLRCPETAKWMDEK